MPPRRRASSGQRSRGAHSAAGQRRSRGRGRHAAPAPAPAAAAANRAPYFAQTRSPVQVARPEPLILEPQKQLTGAPRALIAEFLVCLVLIAAKPFEKAGTDAKLSEGTIGQFAAVMILFFFLALFGGISPRTQKVANLSGALVMLAIFFKNTESVAAIAKAVQGSVKTPGTPVNNADTGPNNAGSAPTSTGA